MKNYESRSLCSTPFLEVNAIKKYDSIRDHGLGRDRGCKHDHGQTRDKFGLIIVIIKTII